MKSLTLQTGKKVRYEISFDKSGIIFFIIKFSIHPPLLYRSFIIFVVTYHVFCLFAPWSVCRVRGAALGSCYVTTRGNVMPITDGTAAGALWDCVGVLTVRNAWGQWYAECHTYAWVMDFYTMLCMALLFLDEN